MSKLWYSRRGLFGTINEEQEIHGRQKVVRGLNVPVLTSHAGLNPSSKSGNESSLAGELSKMIQKHRQDQKKEKKMEEKARISKKEEKIEPKKEETKASKTRNRQNIYVKAIGMIKQVNTMLDTFEGIGLKMDFDDDRTPVGKVMSVMLQNPKDIACEALGVELREEKGYNVGISDDHLLPVTLEVYYPASGNVEFSITFEGLWDLLDRAGQDAECAKNIWDCFVNEKEEAKEVLKNKYNATGFGEVDEK